MIWQDPYVLPTILVLSALSTLSCRTDPLVDLSDLSDSRTDPARSDSIAKPPTARSDLIAKTSTAAMHPGRLTTGFVGGGAMSCSDSERCPLRCQFELPVMLPFKALGAGDYNGDGHIDLVGVDEDKLVACNGDGRGACEPDVGPSQEALFRRLNSMDAVARAALGVRLGLFKGPHAAQWIPIDVNGDGVLENLESSDSDTAWVRYEDGRREPIDASEIKFVGAFERAAVVDYDGDGVRELVLGLYDAVREVSRLVVLRHSSGRWVVVYASSYTPGDVLLVGDVNGDKKLDLIMDHRVLLAHGKHQGASGYDTIEEAIGTPLTVADFDGDARPDVLVYDAGKLGIKTLGRPAVSQVWNAVDKVQAVVAGDFDSDGRIDFAMGDSIWLNGGDGVFRGPRVYSTPLRAKPPRTPLRAKPPPVPMLGALQETRVDDVNGDGKLDVVLINASRAVWFDDPQSATAEPISLALRRPLLVAPTFELGDVNGDGHVDLVVGFFSELNPDTLQVYFGDGRGAFKLAVEHDLDAKPFLLGSSTIATKMTVADFNSDGFDDIVMGYRPVPRLMVVDAEGILPLPVRIQRQKLARQYRTLIFRGNASGVELLRIGDITLPTDGVVDVNGDGMPDLMSGGRVVLNSCAR